MFKKKLPPNEYKLVKKTLEIMSENFTLFDDILQHKVITTTDDIIRIINSIDGKKNFPLE